MGTRTPVGVEPAARPGTSLIPPRPTRVAAAETPRAAMASPVVVGATIIAALYFGREIFIPIAIALLLSFVLTPLVNRLRRLRLPRLAAVGVSVLLTVGIVAALATLIGIQAADLAGDVPRYRDTIERKIDGLRNSPVGHVTQYVANIGRALHGAKEAGSPETQSAAQQSATPPSTPPSTPSPGPEPTQAAPKPVLVEVATTPPGSLEMLSTVLTPVMHPLATVGIVFVVLLFVLMQREDLRDRMIRLAGSSDLHRTTVAIDDAAKRLSRYFVVQLALNAAFGVVIGIGLYIIGVPNPVLWAIFAALMRFVPYLGAVLSAILPMALAAAVDPGWNMMIAVAILFIVLEPLTGQVFEPIFYGQSTGLSPFAVLVSALFWTWLWGPVGLLLSTPLTVCLVVLGRYVEHLEFLDVLFGDRPALTPVQNFYQRILAGDSEEVLGHAELILQQCSLSSYYDEVVLKALELAARDAARGVLTAQQKGAMRAALTELVADLSDRSDAVTGATGEGEESACSPLPMGPAPEALPAAWTREGAVLCVAGRGFLDEAAAAILAQILEKRGLGVRTVPFAETASVRIGRFEAGPARIACVVSLALDGEPTHLRRLIRRLRGRVPGVPVLLGLWLAQDGGANRLAGGPGGAAEADAQVGSLREAVEAILAAAQEDAAAADAPEGGSDGAAESAPDACGETAGLPAPARA
ncbi:putative PurR-regulated permease PerM [Methylobacterium sp. PvP062]|jgi:predicted PurR-regulated permease PerM|uniref:PurR-regulated permease PerM n=1 Tax=Methylobacterium radiotolerans TaxID=31998 RepID=A0ABV2NPM7_9HYPH|nr:MULTISPECIES: AI-2E family transporter [Methylobacterium]MCX7334768.1 AI-2E family transporter [Hyphomicrobiales bacterium]MBN6822429.1 AI-2E family transporter [Methylobacterium organophilum]MBP2494819.1 putative PurR-regulated permease PerM [Methylobacterium sp. PvP105]MBP2505310.1 putative PurR-regulated permease PerM [Methylobacterium sp. PvP109]OXE41203.1 AI-2E family transporter [Methylobacterium radiotolerans]